MIGILFLALLAVPIAELWVIFKVASGIGFFETLVLLVAISIVGAWLLKQQGLATWRRLQELLARGEIPTKEVTDGAMILVGGALLLTPGFITDAVGLLLLLPPTRIALKGIFGRMVARGARRRFGGRAIYTATVIRSERREATSELEATSERVEIPPAAASSSEDGSPGRG